MTNEPNLDPDILRRKIAMPNVPEPKAPTTAMLRLFTVIMAGSVLGVGLAGCVMVDTMRYVFTDDRRVDFWVVDGKVDKDSVRINTWFPIGYWTEERGEPGGGGVFGFPFDENGGDPYRCYYEKNGVPYYKDYPTPPVPPCP